MREFFLRKFAHFFLFSFNVDVVNGESKKAEVLKSRD